MSGESAPNKIAADLQLYYGKRRYFFLLMALLIVLTLPTVHFGFGMTSRWFDGFMAVVMLTAILSLCYERHQRIFAIALGIPTIMFTVGGHPLPDDVGKWVLLFGHVCGVTFLFGTTTFIIQSLSKRHAITADSLYGAVCGFLLLGVAWGMFFSMLETFFPGSFDIDPVLSASADSEDPGQHVLIYFSFVTLTTLGYGDVTPISPTARTMSWIEAVSGQFYLGIIVAGLVSVLVAKTISQREPDDSERES